MRDLPPEDVAQSPSGDWFVKSHRHKGVLPEILDELLTARKKWVVCACVCVCVHARARIVRVQLRVCMCLFVCGLCSWPEGSERGAM